jgi:hypothetical protein
MPLTPDPRSIDMNASDEIRALSVAELDEVSGAKSTTYDLGIFGKIELEDNGCWTYSLMHVGPDGSNWQTRSECPPL